MATVKDDVDVLYKRYR